MLVKISRMQKNYSRPPRISNDAVMAFIARYGVATREMILRYFQARQARHIAKIDLALDKLEKAVRVVCIMQVRSIDGKDQEVPTWRVKKQVS